jgi:hypothetical protein
VEEDEEEEETTHPRVDRLSKLEQAILRRIREVKVHDFHNFQHKDIETLRDKVVQKLCDEDRNFARYYMSLIVKDMRYLSIRRPNLPDREKEVSSLPAHHQLEGALYKLYSLLN